MKPKYTLDDVKRYAPAARLVQAMLFVANELHSIAEALREKKKR